MFLDIIFRSNSGLPNSLKYNAYCVLGTSTPNGSSSRLNMQYLANLCREVYTYMDIDILGRNLCQMNYLPFKKHF